MPGRGNRGGNAGGHGHGMGGARADGPLGNARPDTGAGQPGRSGWAPGQMKRDAGAASARDFAPGHGGDAPGQVGRNGGGGAGAGADGTAQSDSQLS
jgi:hypothetical protein